MGFAESNSTEGSKPKALSYVDTTSFPENNLLENFSGFGPVEGIPQNIVTCNRSERLFDP